MLGQNLGCEIDLGFGPKQVDEASPTVGAKQTDPQLVLGILWWINKDDVLKGGSQLRRPLQGSVIDNRKTTVGFLCQPRDLLVAAAVTGDQRRAAVEASQAGGAVAE